MNIEEGLNFNGIHVIDGGLATELERHGCDLSGPLWSAHVLESSPETIQAVHLDYLRAGADCLATASYQISERGYREMGASEQDAAWALIQSVQIASMARSEYARESSRRIWIAASLGPYGAALHNGAEYHGRYPVGAKVMTAFHADRLAVLAGTESDFVAFETIPSREEAGAVLRALEETPGLKAWISFTCLDRLHVAHGEPLRDCAAEIAHCGQVLAVGVNCTAPHLIADLIAEARAGCADALPVIVYPNSGEIWDAGTRSWNGRSDPPSFGALARRWYDTGAQAVGGCCRTGPDHIRAVAEVAQGRWNCGHS